ncbi:hypothetical protein [Paenibacillus polymyxa]|uniref:hypothetical protein n=1 Tax=Paenibacillus polymyxa TaxID=1406 RepID=UPI002024C49D|nr:hypothetical protein [Paenibacillus polymyxa]URJ58063.1 hypothetical protein MF622_002563 [Paenibacillus polymyxa]
MSVETLQDYSFRVFSRTLVPMNGKVAKRSGSKVGLWLATRNMAVAALPEEERFAFFSNEFKKTSDWDDVWRPSGLSNKKCTVTTSLFLTRSL